MELTGKIRHVFFNHPIFMAFKTVPNPYILDLMPRLEVNLGQAPARLEPGSMDRRLRRWQGGAETLLGRSRHGPGGNACPGRDPLGRLARRSKRSRCGGPDRRAGGA